MKYIFSGIIFSIIFFSLSCNAQNEKYRIAKLVTNDLIYLPGPSSDLARYPSIHKTDTGQYLFTYFQNPNTTLYQNSNIFVYDIDKRNIVDSIPVGKNLKTFYYLSSDSIFVFYNPRSKPGFKHDTLLLRINSRGDTLDIYSFKETPAVCSESPAHPDSIFVVSNNYGDLKYHEDKIFFTFWHYSAQNMGDSTFGGINFPRAGHIDLKTNKFVQHNGIDYPFLKHGEYYPDAYKSIYLEIGDNGNPIYSFAYTSLIYEYDLKTGNIKEYSLKSLLADTITPFLSKDNANERFPFLSQPKYSGIRYNIDKQIYLRQIHLPSQSIMDIRSVFVVYDNEYNRLAEGKNLWTQIFSDSYIYNYEYNKNKADSVCFSVNTIEFIPAEKKDILNFWDEFATQSKQKGAINKYIREEMQITDSNPKGIIIPTLACPSCVITTLEFYKTNYELFSKNSVYLIMAISADSIRDRYLKDTKLNAKDNNILIDHKDIYMRYHDKTNFGPHLVVLENDIIVHDKVYAPKEMREMQLKILQHLNSEVEYKE